MELGHLTDKIDPVYLKKAKKFSPLLVLAAAGLFATDYTVIAALVLLSVVTPLVLVKLEIKLIGIEFVTLTTVIIALKFGSGPGALAGLLLMTAHMVAGQYSGPYIIWVIPSYAVLGFLAATLGMPVGQLGIVLALGANIFFTVMTATLTPDGLPYFAPHAVGNVILNFLLFSYVAPQLVTLAA